MAHSDFLTRHAGRYQIKHLQREHGIHYMVRATREMLAGPNEEPPLAARVGVAAASLIGAAAATAIVSTFADYTFIEFYLVACVIATWYGGLTIGLGTVGCASILQFNSGITMDGWEFNRAGSWIRMFVLAAAAIAIAALWDALQRRTARLHEAIADLQTVIDVTPAAMVIAEEPECRYIRINPLMARLMGTRPGIIASVTGPDDEQPTNFVFTRDGVPVPGEHLPVQRAAFTANATPREPLEIIRDDGATIHLIGQAVPLFDNEGNVRGSVGAFLDVTELRATEQELRQANDVKDEFLALVSHELRTPITVIAGNAEVLDARWKSLSDEMRSVAISDIRLESERLSQLIDNLLALSRLGLMQLAREPVKLRPIVERIVEEHRALHIGREIEITGDVPPVMGAPGAIPHVIENLLTNAEKYGPPAGVIDVSLRKLDGEVEIAVRDQGGGPSPDELERMFDPFYRSKAGVSVLPGMGIGLTVCKRLVEAQGGNIWARHLKDGFEVAFTLPLANNGLAAK